MSSAVIRATTLNDPLYYLRNLQQVIQYCCERYKDLFLAAETRQLDRLSSLDTSAQALLARIVMRKGPRYRTDSLRYTEIADVQPALDALSAADLIDAQPAVGLSELSALCRRDECLQLARHLQPQQHFAASTRKRDLVASLRATPLADTEVARCLSDWWPEAPFALVELSCGGLFDRLRLMFFGNLRQNWSEFVLTELGLQQFEPVPLTAESRPFQQRSDMELYLQLHELRRRVDSGEPVAAVCQALPGPAEADWVNYRRHKVLFQLGREAERQQNPELALSLYQQSRHRAARLRNLRLLEKQAQPETVFHLASAALAEIEQPEIRTSLHRILQRSARRSGGRYVPPPRTAVPSTELVLPKPGQERVEAAVIAHLRSADTELFHVENQLFNGLFGLLFWRALFAPVRGAFFNPFQAAPADLYRPDFAASRAACIDEAFDQLRSGDYRSVIRERLRRKRGIRCSFVHWATLTPELVEPALAIIPARHLAAVFRHLLLDLRHHRRGLPDLIALNTKTADYRLIEVKGPGDRLQDHQRLWIDAMLAQGLPVSVCTVRWRTP